MDFHEGGVTLNGFLSVTLGIIVLFLGKRMNQRIGFLREYSIPEPVSGGLLVSVLLAVFFVLSGVAVDFELGARDVLLIYFFTTIGINARVSDLLQGGKPLIILLVVTIAYMILQNLTGVGVATLLGLPGEIGLLGGSVALIGGHGTAIAWAPRFAEEYGIEGAMEIGIACATFGLILASLMGGPIAKFLIKRHDLKPAHPAEALDVGESQGQPSREIDYLDLLGAILAIHIAIILGLILGDLIKESVGLDLPDFVPCLFAGIFLTNLIKPLGFARLTGMSWPSRQPSLALIAEISLGAFLAMSLMSMQLWTLVELAGPIFAILAIQFVVTVAVNLLIVFPAMGRTYDAAVIAAGFGGFALGATPTAMANMTAVTQRFGPSHVAFVVVPLVSAFFIDLANALIIPTFLNFLNP